MGSKLRTLSWVLLALVGALLLFGSLASAGVAYTSPSDQIGPISLEELAAGRADVRVALQARRGTAAAFGAGYAILFLLIVLVPYRRGEVWAWWAVLSGSLVSAGLVLVRIPALGTRLGLAGAFPLVVVVIALLLDASRLKRTAAQPAV